MGISLGFDRSSGDEAMFIVAGRRGAKSGAREGGGYVGAGGQRLPLWHLWDRRELGEVRNEGNGGLHHPRQNLDLVCQAKERLDGDGRWNGSDLGR